MPQPLEGLLVLDWTISQQGSVASAMLGDMGARVIKIEQRGTGDPGRYLLGAGGADTSSTQRPRRPGPRACFRRPSTRASSRRSTATTRVRARRAHDANPYNPAF